MGDEAMGDEAMGDGREIKKKKKYSFFLRISKKSSIFAA